jgi:catechol 2,3-dioxygenase-like lactoylglutathione lyase family enzyme
MRLAAVTYLVRDYDEAIIWFTRCLGFTLTEDTDLGAGKRWVRMTVPGGGSDLLLAKAVGDQQEVAVGNAAGSRVAYFLHCKDFETTRKRMEAAGVRFREKSRHENYGTVAVFEDLYGNTWDLIEPKALHTLPLP